MAMPEIVGLLDALGFRGGCTVEAMVATRNADGSQNAAPMGVTRTGSDLLEIKPYRSSATYRNLSERGEACVNLTDNPCLFLVTSFKREDLRGFKRPRIDEGLSLGSADASVFVEVLSSGEVSRDRGRFPCRALSIEVRRRLPRAFSRGRAEAIEAVVHATRIEAYMHQGRRGDAEKPYKRFNECKGVVEGVSSPDSAEVRVMEALEALISRWMKALR